ncbi:hypothetical protein DFH94DRAFT_843819 [Russula ochroleuca]|uniref:Uncharacterized protein n=1 Tax=Russula ochroleuca TaxID=152965 RepID=A0A9P5MZR6_9AGAM|nr:hypothetical protein DFH94DRAFT_843819 [Russula ochroleuca]
MPRVSGTELGMMAVDDCTDFKLRSCSSAATDPSTALTLSNRTDDGSARLAFITLMAEAETQVYDIGSDSKYSDIDDLSSDPDDSWRYLVDRGKIMKDQTQLNMLSPTQDDAAEDPGFSSIRQVNHNLHSHLPPGLQHDPGLLQENGGWLTVHIIAEEKKSLRCKDKTLNALSDEKKDKYQKVRAGVYPQGPTQTREGQVPSTRFKLGRICAVAETPPPPRRHDNITVSAIVDSVVTGRGRRRCRNGGKARQATIDDRQEQVGIALK